MRRSLDIALAFASAAFAALSSTRTSKDRDAAEEKGHAMGRPTDWRFAFAALIVMLGASLAESAQLAAALPAAPFTTAFPTRITKVMCKYGTPNCVNPKPGPRRPKAGDAEFPDSGWIDPDCKYYGNCGTGDAAELGRSVDRAEQPPKDEARRSEAGIQGPTMILVVATRTPARIAGPKEA